MINMATFVTLSVRALAVLIPFCVLVRFGLVAQWDKTKRES